MNIVVYDDDDDVFFLEQTSNSKNFLGTELYNATNVAPDSPNKSELSCKKFAV